MATVPTDPEIPRLFEVKLKLMEFARADETHRKKTDTANTDFAKLARMRVLQLEQGKRYQTEVHEKGRSLWTTGNGTACAVVT